MPILKKHTKQSYDEKDYDIDYTRWLSEFSPADTLAAATASVECTSAPPDAALVVSIVTITATRAKLMVIGGTDGKVYKVTVRATTAGVDGVVRKDECELQFTIKDV